MTFTSLILIFIKYSIFTVLTTISMLLSFNMFVRLSSKDYILLGILAIFMELLKCFLLVRGNTINEYLKNNIKIDFSTFPDIFEKVKNYIKLKSPIFRSYLFYLILAILSILASFGFTLTVINNEKFIQFNSSYALQIKEAEINIELLKNQVDDISKQINTLNTRLSENKYTSERDYVNDRYVLSIRLNEKKNINNELIKWQKQLTDLKIKESQEKSQKVSSVSMFYLMAETFSSILKKPLSEENIILFLFLTLSVVIEAGIIVTSPIINVKDKHLMHIMGMNLDFFEYFKKYQRKYSIIDEIINNDNTIKTEKDEVKNFNNTQNLGIRKLRFGGNEGDKKIENKEIENKNTNTVNNIEFFKEDKIKNFIPEKINNTTTNNFLLKNDNNLDTVKIKENLINNDKTFNEDNNLYYNNKEDEKNTRKKIEFEENMEEHNIVLPFFKKEKIYNPKIRKIVNKPFTMDDQNLKNLQDEKEIKNKNNNIDENEKNLNNTITIIKNELKNEEKIEKKVNNGNLNLNISENKIENIKNNNINIEDFKKNREIIENNNEKDLNKNEKDNNRVKENEEIQKIEKKEDNIKIESSSPQAQTINIYRFGKTTKSVRNLFEIFIKNLFLNFDETTKKLQPINEVVNKLGIKDSLIKTFITRLKEIKGYKNLPMIEERKDENGDIYYISNYDLEYVLNYCLEDLTHKITKKEEVLNVK